MTIFSINTIYLIKNVINILLISVSVDEENIGVVGFDFLVLADEEVCELSLCSFVQNEFTKMVKVK